MSRANKALLAALAVLMYGTQPNRMLAVRLKPALLRTPVDHMVNFNCTVVPRADKLYVYYLEDIQDPGQARIGVGGAGWDVVPTNNHVVAYKASSPQAALEFMTRPRKSEYIPRCVPVDIRLLHVDRFYRTQAGDAQRTSNVRNTAAGMIQTAFRNSVVVRNTRNAIYRPPNGPGYLAARRRYALGRSGSSGSGSRSRSSGSGSGSHSSRSR
jgi:hypothetical protein